MHFCSGINLKIYDQMIHEAPNKILIPHCSEASPPYYTSFQKISILLIIPNNSNLALFHQKSQIKPKLKKNLKL